MAEQSLPYLNAYGNITKALKKIQTAQTPPRFTQDFLATKLDLTGGGARPLIPFLKRIGFLGSDGTPTTLYRRFRNEADRGAAAAEALRTGYKPLFEINEYAQDLKDADLKGLVVQYTGLDADSSAVKGIVSSFKALKSFADFEAKTIAVDDSPPGDTPEGPPPAEPASTGFNIGYTINLNLPATSEIAVFNAIFKSLREHLLR
jgi:hypothetical protein